jgi:hypothetical protein
MDCGWSVGEEQEADNAKTVLIRARHFGPITWGTCRFWQEPLKGFWYLMVRGFPLLSFSGEC